MRLMITVQATEHADELVNSGGVVVIINELPAGLFGDRGDGANETLADFIAKEAGYARKRFEGRFKPEVAIQIIQ